MRLGRENLVAFEEDLQRYGMDVASSVREIERRESALAGRWA